MLVFLAACGGSDSATGTGDGGTTPIGTGSSSGTSGTSGSSGSSGTTDPGDGGADPDSGADAGPVLVGSAPSCAQPNGGNTCGPDGTDDCCKSLPVPMPGAPFKLDKYNITAGRMRSFITAVNGNARGWIQAHRPAWFEPAWDKYIPSEMDDGTVQTTNNHTYDANQGFDGAYQQLGPIHYGVEGPGNEGCLTKEIGNARTYRIDDATNTKLFADTQQYDQAPLDKKSLQCVTFFMVAAFCAWDGGRVPSLTELDYAWDSGSPSTHTFPWGNTPAPGGWSDAYADMATAKADGKVTPTGSNQTFANYEYNFWEPAEVKCIGAQCDYSIYIAPPGRFPKGDGPFGHSDLAGNVYQVTLPMTGTVGTDPLTAGRLVQLGPGGAFDTHKIPTTRSGTPEFGKWKPFNKYIATGGRCARDM